MGILYTDQMHNTNKLQAFLKDPNAEHTGFRRTSGFGLLVCPVGGKDHKTFRDDTNINVTGTLYSFT